VLRGWLLHLKRCALQGQRLPSNERFLVVTGGWGPRCPLAAVWVHSTAFAALRQSTAELCQVTAATCRAGWGRHSANNVPRLRPMVARMLGEELGAPLALQPHPSTAGAFFVDADKCACCLKPHLIRFKLRLQAACLPSRRCVLSLQLQHAVRVHSNTAGVCTPPSPSFAACTNGC
jgi:hypothetical protein